MEACAASAYDRSRLYAEVARFGCGFRRLISVRPPLGPVPRVHASDLSIRFIRTDHAARFFASVKSLLPHERMSHLVDFQIYEDPAQLDSTAFFEIGPGPYTNKHWQPGFIFVAEDAFSMAEGIVARHFPAYDHFAVNTMPKSVSTRIIAEWAHAAAQITNLEAKACARLLNFDAAYRYGLDDILQRQRAEIARFLNDLASKCSRINADAESLCVLGM